MEGMIYEGKAKKVFATDNADILILEFKDSLTAFNAQKKGSFGGKGRLNREIASLIFKELKRQGIESHFIEDIDDVRMQVKKVRIIPLEVVIRNTLAGSTAKKLGLEEGKALPRPLVEFYYKDDALNDPFVSDDQAIIFGFAKESELQDLKFKALKINDILISLFHSIGIKLIDFKLEFGVTSRGEIVLADEITPDCCRLWDEVTHEKLDKDRFRRDLGKVEESYTEVLNRLRKLLEKREG